VAVADRGGECLARDPPKPLTGAHGAAGSRMNG
jgi:hypothetical protein